MLANVLREDNARSWERKVYQDSAPDARYGLHYYTIEPRGALEQA